jgi:hypothetical protein
VFPSPHDRKSSRLAGVGLLVGVTLFFPWAGAQVIAVDPVREWTADKTEPAVVRAEYVLKKADALGAGRPNAGGALYAFNTSDIVLMNLHSGRQYPALSLSSG